MSTYTVVPEAICTTCLTQGRKMYPFPSKHAIPFAMFYKDFALAGRDKVCWECKHFIHKMADFRKKAMAAQDKLSILYSKRFKQPVVLQSLSKLTVSTGIYLEIQHEPDFDPLLVKSEDSVKVEEDFEKSESELDLYQSDVLEPQDSELSHEEHFQVFQHKTLVAPESRYQEETDVSQDGGLENVTLMSLLTRKSSQLFPLLPNETPSPTSPPEIKQEIDIEEHPPEPKTVQRPAQQSFTEHRLTEESTQQSFTVHRLTEEEMRRWWESKRENEFYAKSIPVFRCEKCVEPFFTRRSYLGHVKMHTEMYGAISCDICQLRFNTQSALTAHRDNHYKLLKCGHCAHQWDNPNSMRRHCNTEHHLPCVTVWSCNVCPRQLPTYGRFLNHVKSHSTAPCPDCGRRVAVVGMKVHQLTHESTSEKKYECADCGAKFRTKNGVGIHLQAVHNSKQFDPAAFCTQCDKQFRNVRSLKNHLKFATKHVSQELLRHKCGICARAFVSAVLLRRHVEAKHSEERNYPCRLCPVRFRNTTARARHRRLSHEGYVAPRDKMCDHCGKAFKTKMQLSNHINTHTGARPFVCKLCGADFGHKSALYLHGRYKHKIPKKNGKVHREDSVKQS